MNMRVVNTLIKKDFKNCFSNKNLLVSGDSRGILYPVQ